MTGETIASAQAQARRPAGATRVDYAGPSAPRRASPPRAFDQPRRWVAAEKETAPEIHHDVHEPQSPIAVMTAPTSRA